MYSDYMKKLNEEFGIEEVEEFKKEFGEEESDINVLSSEIGRYMGETFTKIVKEMSENGVSKEMIVKAFRSYYEQSEIDDDFNDYVYTN